MGVLEGDLIGSQSSQSARLELQHIDQTDEVHAGVIEAVVALVVRGLAESIEVFGLGCIGGVMLARNRMQLRGPQLAEQLLGRVEFRGLGQMRDVAGVNDQRRLRRHAVDVVDCLGQRAIDVRIRFLVEADMRVADLHEQRLAQIGGSVFVGGGHGQVDGHQYPTRQCKQGPGSAVSHAFQRVAARQRHFVVGHIPLQVSCGSGEGDSQRRGFIPPVGGGPRGWLVRRHAPAAARPSHRGIGR
jgi:hypothetical protein